MEQHCMVKSVHTAKEALLYRLLPKSSRHPFFNNLDIEYLFYEQVLTYCNINIYKGVQYKHIVVSHIFFCLMKFLLCLFVYKFVSVIFV